jgi:superfamily II DNA helicase RecQ
MCHEISDQLNQLGFKATFYHGGLQKTVKEKAARVECAL